jgi:hypothetical protein
MNNSNLYNFPASISRKQFADIAYYQPQYQQSFHTALDRSRCLASNYSPNYNAEIASQVYKNPNFKMKPPGQIPAVSSIATVNNAITTNSTNTTSINAPVSNDSAATTKSQPLAKKSKPSIQIVRWAELSDLERQALESLLGHNIF